MTNPVRPCAACGQVDDHPKHTISYGPHDASMHLDCCAMNRSCESCVAQLADVGGVGKNPTGDKLRDHLVTTGPDADKPGWTAPSDDEKAGA